MDGERRIGEQMKHISGLLSALNARGTRIAARSFGLFAVMITILHGVSLGGYFEDPASPWSRLPGKLASIVGMAADDIHISGLTQHDPSQILQSLGVKPGGSLIGFDANAARASLQSMPWVKSASVARDYPNMLKISIEERVGIALWQHNNDLQLVDEQGVAMGQPRYLTKHHLLIVTGDGANTAAAELLNQLSAIPDLSLQVSAAARVGKRRWTLYLDSGVKVALPEEGVGQALAMVWSLDQQQGLFARGISMIDMRIPERVTVQVAEVEEAAAPGVKTAQKK